MTDTITFEVAVGAATDAGRVRPTNQDAYLAARPIFLVADGMGGHSDGQAASAAVVDSFRPLGGRRVLQPLEVRAAIAEASQRVRELADGGLPPGSTLAGVALSVQGGLPYWLVFNVGDSRVYFQRGSELQQISVDHSRRQEMLDAGVPEDQVHEQRNVITRAIGGGMPGDPVVDQWLEPAHAGDRVLLCSDGIHTELDDALIRAILRSVADPAEAAQLLLDTALDAGGHDNATAVVLDATHVVPAVPTLAQTDTWRDELDVTLVDDTLERTPHGLVD